MVPSLTPYDFALPQDDMFTVMNSAQPTVPSLTPYDFALPQDDMFTVMNSAQPMVPSLTPYDFALPQDDMFTVMSFVSQSHLALSDIAVNNMFTPLPAHECIFTGIAIVYCYLADSRTMNEIIQPSHTHKVPSFYCLVVILCVRISLEMDLRENMNLGSQNNSQNQRETFMITCTPTVM